MKVDLQTAKDIATTIARSNNRVYLTADSLLLNIMSDSGANEYLIVVRIDDVDVCLKKSLEMLIRVILSILQIFIICFIYFFCLLTII